MPHLIIQVGAGVSASEQESLLRNAHRALLDSGEVKVPINLKSRVVQAERELIGHEGPSASFVHAELRLLVGRSPETRQRLADLVLAALSEDLRPEIETSVEVNELPAAYAKRNLSR
jgi:5-carboxymethyl-2-hydroxymuconate isomerase